MNNTAKALMARGLDSAFSSKMANIGWTLSKLKQTTEVELAAQGFPKDFVENLFKEDRPPIPTQTLMKLLFDNRFQCCVCRDPAAAFIVHHIDDWATSRSHAIENLAVLCLNHHDMAHTTKSLSQNLDRFTLQKLKAQWESAVKDFDKKAILDAMRLEYSTWNFINELRVFEMAAALEIDLSSNKFFDSARARDIIDINGVPIAPSGQDLYYLYEGPYILLRYAYTSYVFNEVIRRIAIVNISDFFDKGVLGVAITPGDIVFTQGSHLFSPTTDKKSGKGRGQFCEGIRRANGVEVRFMFDRWEATSSSAKTGWLVGTKYQGSLVHVKEVSRVDGQLVINGTVLGVCSNMVELKKRDYDLSWLNWRPGS